MTYVIVSLASLSFLASCTLASPVAVVLVLNSIECLVVIREPVVNGGVVVGVLVDEKGVVLLCSVNNVFAAEDVLLLESTAEDVFSVDVIVVVPFLLTFGFVAVVGSTAVLAQRKKRH